MMFRALAAFCLFASPALAQDWALDGMDPVSYAVAGAAVPGRADLVTHWRGKAWHFVSEDHRSQFEANPKAYAPGMDGLCIVALSEGRPEPGNPRHFVVVGKRTYFVRSEAARAKFLADPQRVLTQAQANWARSGH